MKIMQKIQIVFRDVPNTPDLLFVEVENQQGQSIRVGEWRTREDGYKVLELWMRLERLPAQIAPG